ncbi:MAG: MFS transporter [Planctomycetota bacterium]|nr:MFS transporter [Planctomycetota bacterium]
MFRLSVERRASQAGVLLAAGHTWASVAGMLWREGILIAACGCTAGVPVGAGYARLLIGGLGGIWSGAVGGEALAMRINWASAAIGWAAGFALSLTAMWWGMRPLRLAPVAHLLGGWKAMAARRRASGSPAYRPVRRFGGDRKAAAWAGLCAMAAGVVLAAVAPATGMLAEAAFFGAGALLLIGALALFRALLDRMRRGLSGGASVPDARDPEGRDVPSLAKMAIRSAALNPSRSVASVGLMACASFVLAAVSINWSGRGTEESLRPDSGTGGFVLVATTEISVPADIGSESGRRSLGIGGDAGGGPAGALQRAAVYSCRMSDGDEAGCLNARQPVVPRIIGVPASLIARGGFAFAEVADTFAGSGGPQEGGSGTPEGGGRFPTESGGPSDGSSESPAGNSKSATGNGGSPGGSAGIPGGSAAPAASPVRTNPWRLLDRRLPCGAIPAFADADSARWILKKGLGEEIAVPGVGGTVRLKLVGLISRSIFAGALVISEANFIEAFGDGGGYRYFLVEAPAEPGKYGRAEARDRDAAGTWAAAFRAELSRELERFGVETAPTSDVLAAYASVRDAYLSAFGALGGLALLLARETSFPLFLAWSVLYAVVYIPTLSLSNSICFHHVADAKKGFPRIRVWGTIGWIAAGWFYGFFWQGWLVRSCGWSLRDAYAGSFLFSAILSFVLAAYSLLLPHTPPRKDAAEKNAALAALRLLKDPPFLAIFSISFIVLIAHTFYFVWMSPLLKGIGIPDDMISPVMTIGQISEIALMLLVPVSLARMGFKFTMGLGLLAYVLRFAACAIGSPQWLVVASLALHGFCYGFFVAVVFIFVDACSPPDIRASAQSLIGIVILGLGPLVGSLFAGKVGDIFSTLVPVPMQTFYPETASFHATATQAVRLFRYDAMFWTVTAVSLLALVLFLVFFNPRDGKKTETA